MPSRVIRGEINASRSLSRVSMEADLTFRALIVAVDDYGRCEADPLMLKALLFPRRERVSPKHVRGWVDELAAEGCVRIYRADDGLEYLCLPAWEDHRGKSKRAPKSKHPDPPREIPGDSGSPRDSQEIRPIVSGSGGYGLETSGRSAPGNPGPRGAPRRVLSDCPEALSEEQQEALRAWCSKKHPSLVRELPEIWDELVTWAKANGHRKADWYAQMQTFVRRRAERAGPGPPTYRNGQHGPPRPAISKITNAERYAKTEIPVD